MNDFRIALRGLLRTPGFTVAVIVSLAVGIGASVTAYHWIDAFVLHPLPAVGQSDRLISVYTKGPGGAEWSLSYPRFQKWREAVAGTIDLALTRPEQLSLRTEGSAPDRLWGDLVSGNFFDVVGVRAIAGRTLTLDDERAAAQVVVLSERYWDRRFRRDPAIVGKPVLINGQGFTVVGIVPAKFGGTTVGFALDGWLPVTTKPALDPGNAALTDDNWQWLEGRARFRDDRTFEQARAAMEDASRRVSQSLGEQAPTLAGIRTLGSAGAGRFVGPLFYTILGLAVIILLIACANIANLLVVRATRRGREIGLRLALGADRWRIVRQLLTESWLLAGAGGLLGLLLTSWGKGLLGAVMPSLPFPINLTTEVSLRVVGVAVLVTAGTSLLFGVVPALRASRPDLVSSIKDDRSPGSRRALLQSSLVVAQVALSLTALVAAGLFLRSLAQARNADPGFRNADRVLAINSDFRLAGLHDSVSSRQLEQVLAGIRGIPGVLAAGTTTDLPVSMGGHSSSGLSPEGYQAGPDENMSIEYARVSPGYFEALGVPVSKGRAFTEQDRADAPAVVIVNEAFVRRFWPNRDPIGARVRVWGRDRVVVGVVGPIVMERFGEPVTPYVHYPVAQSFEPQFTLTISSQGDPALLVEAVRGVMRSVNPDLPVLDPRTMRENMAGAMFVQSTGATLLGGLGMIALGLAALGLYAVLAFAVSQRTREIGIRMALGSLTSGIVALVVRQAAILVVVGVVIGGALAVGVANLIRSQLFGVQATDPVTFSAVIALLAVVALLAAAVPAGRAARVDPVRTLRID